MDKAFDILDHDWTRASKLETDLAPLGQMKRLNASDEAEVCLLKMKEQRGL